jgi:hypothetical protein
MADATPDVESIPYAIERQPFAHQLEKIEVPPIIAGVAEILGRVGLQGAKLVGHHDPKTGIRFSGECS